jgi:hypothetical protein
MATVKCPAQVDAEKLASVIRKWGDGKLDKLVDDPRVTLVVSEPSQDDIFGKYNPNLEKHVLVAIFQDDVSKFDPFQVPFEQVVK